MLSNYLRVYVMGSVRMVHKVQSQNYQSYFYFTYMYSCLLPSL